MKEKRNNNKEICTKDWKRQHSSILILESFYLHNFNMKKVQDCYGKFTKKVNLTHYSDRHIIIVLHDN